MFLGLLPILFIPVEAMCSSPNPDFSGTWKQSNERCIPRRKGDVVLRIENRGPELVVETTAHRGSEPARQAMQRYTTDGNVSVSTGADGDEFHTSIARAGNSLIFSVEEHEDGRVIQSKETWTLIENGTALERVRETATASDSARKQTLIYVREAPNTGTK
jgi:hypothetical protein